MKTGKEVRVRFAPSPTGPLHIGGVRTALFNYLLARQNGGSFILRIEDTDQNRYVKGAEDYIIDALSWAGLTTDEGPTQGGEFGPYRQSERLSIYQQYANTLIENGWAYKAYDTPEELTAKREAAKSTGNHNWQYDSNTRMEMRNSLSLSKVEIEQLDAENTPFVIRFKVPKGETIQFTDLVREQVEFSTDVLDDKVLYKADGFPTYHMANVIDDYSMKISHVIRGEEWLSSTPLHVLLYKALGWESEMPEFAHLPLILKPTGKGKLSKRDGAKFGFPVFPLNWNDETTGEVWPGYKETGFSADGFTNMLAFLGWNPGSEQEIFTLEELIKAFDIQRVSKAGARFDYDKAKWFNQQHLITEANESIAKRLQDKADELGVGSLLMPIINLYKERVEFASDILTEAKYVYREVDTFDEKMIRKKWKPELSNQFQSLASQLNMLTPFTAQSIEASVKEFMAENNLGFGQVLPTLRLAVCGTMKGPSIFEVMELVGQEEVVKRIQHGIDYFNTLKEVNE